MKALHLGVGGRAQTLAAQQGGDRLQVERGLQRLQPAQELLACSAGLLQQRFQSGALSAELGSVRLLRQHHLLADLGAVQVRIPAPVSHPVAPVTPATTARLS